MPSGAGAADLAARAKSASHGRCLLVLLGREEAEPLGLPNTHQAAEKRRTMNNSKQPITIKPILLLVMGPLMA